MKLFMGFILLCFMLATVMRGRGLRLNGSLLLGVITLVCVAYFFFDQI